MRERRRKEWWCVWWWWRYSEVNRGVMSHLFGKTRTKSSFKTLMSTSLMEDYFDRCSQGMSWTGLPLLIIIMRSSCVWSWSLSSCWTIATDNLLHELLIDDGDHHVPLVSSVSKTKNNNTADATDKQSTCSSFWHCFIYLSSHRQKNKSGWLKKSR